MNMFGTPFELFGTVHLITIAVIIVVSVLLPRTYKDKSINQKSTMNKVIAGVIALHVIISPYKDLYLLANPYDWRETLPLHMCDLSEIFLIWFLLGGPKILYLCAHLVHSPLHLVGGLSMVCYSATVFEAES